MVGARTHRWPLRAALVLAGIMGGAMAAAGGPMHGFWMAPEWLFPEGRAPATQGEARRAVSAVLDRLRPLGVDTVFMEALLRGYAIGPARAAGGNALPVYPLCRYGNDGGDLLGIVLEEAAARGMGVHAWVHTFYFRTDNPSLGREGQAGPSILADLIEAELSAAARRAGPGRAQLLAEAARIGGRDLSLAALAEAARRHGVDPVGGPIAAIDGVARRAGAGLTLFLRTPSGDLHPPAARDPWMALWLDPENPQVRRRLVDAIARLARAYPGLKGVHLDHVRYPRGPMGLPPELASLRARMVFPGGVKGASYQRWKAHLGRREGAIASFVGEVREAIGGRMALSAAVHPLYYHDRDDWAVTLNDDDFVAQDWYRWGLDLVVPMIYDSDAARIRRVLRRYRFDLSNRRPARAVEIVPGTNRFELVTGPRALPSWVYFDFDQFRNLGAGRPPPSRLPASGPVERARRLDGDVWEEAGEEPEGEEEGP